MNSSEIKAILMKRIDVKGLLVEDLLSQIIKPALEKMVADSENKYDDMAMAALYPPLEKAIKEQIDSLLSKLLA